MNASDPPREDTWAELCCSLVDQICSMISAGEYNPYNECYDELTIRRKMYTYHEWHASNSPLFAILRRLIDERVEIVVQEAIARALSATERPSGRQDSGQPATEEPSRDPS